MRRILAYVPVSNLAIQDQTLGVKILAVRTIQYLYSAIQNRIFALRALLWTQITSVLMCRVGPTLDKRELSSADLRTTSVLKMNHVERV